MNPPVTGLPKKTLEPYTVPQVCYTGWWIKNSVTHPFPLRRQLPLHSRFHLDRYTCTGEVRKMEGWMDMEREGERERDRDKEREGEKEIEG